MLDVEALALSNVADIIIEEINNKTNQIKNNNMSTEKVETTLTPTNIDNNAKIQLAYR